MTTNYDRLRLARLFVTPVTQFGALYAKLGAALWGVIFLAGRGLPAAN